MVVRQGDVHHGPRLDLASGHHHGALKKGQAWHVGSGHRGVLGKWFAGILIQGFSPQEVTIHRSHPPPTPHILYLVDRVHAEDGRLRGVDDGRAHHGAVHAAVADREGAPGHVVYADGPVARLLAQGAEALRGGEE